MRRGTQIQIETTKMQKAALTSVLEENGATLTEWLTDNIASATADFSVPPIDIPTDLRKLEDLRYPDEIFDQLSEIDWAFSDDNTTYLSHDIHPYPAKFIPQIPRHLIARLTLPGEMVWDPFGGSGTTALEAVLLGRQAISSDVNPLAQVIGKGKLLTLTKEDDDFLSALVEDLFILTSSEDSSMEALKNYPALEDFIPDIPNVNEWFHPIAARELAYLKARILTFASEKCRTIADVCFSKIILESSYQDSETRYARSQKDFPAGKVIRLFAGALESSLKKARYLGTFIRFREAAFLTADLRHDDVVEPNSVDLIVTSPPYSNTTDYHLYHRFRLFWLGFDPRTLAKKEIGSHLRHQKEKSGIQEYLQEIQECLSHMFNGLRPGRFAVMIVGDSMFDGTVFRTAALISASAKAVGFEVVGEIERKLPKHKRSFISTARRLKSESLLLLRKPNVPVLVSIFPPPYKLWPYESHLREMEVECLIQESARNTSQGLLRADIDSLQIDKLRRLTFSHGFSASNFSKEPTWQAILENGDAKVSGRKDPKYVTHGIHSYKGKFYPQLARSLFNLAQLENGHTVLDPFCGSGTVPLEAYLNGLRGIGFDLNPLAVKIATAKTQILQVDPYLRDRVLAGFQHRLSALVPSRTADVFQSDTMKEIESWFPPKVILKLAALIETIKEVPEVRIKEFLEVLLSNIVREVSQQDPEDLRIRRRSQAITDAPVFELFAGRLTEQRRRLAEFASRSNRAPCKFLSSDVSLADSRSNLSFQAAGLRSESVAAVITSPPYATALPYIDTDRLSILLLFGLQSSQRSPLEASLTGSREIRTKSRKEIELAIKDNQFDDIVSRYAREIITRVFTLNENAEVGFRRKNLAALLYRYFSDMTKVMRNLDMCLQVNGSAFFVIGNNSTIAGGQPLAIKSSDVLADTAEAIGWDLERRISITVTKEKRPHSRNSITENEILWFRRRG